MATVKVSKKGWVVIPHEIRDRHGIKPGDKVHIVDYAGRIAIIPAFKDPIAAGYGLLRIQSMNIAAFSKEDLP